MRPVRVAVTIGTALGSAIGLTLAAHGLWSEETTLPGLAKGGVSFSAQPLGSTFDVERQYSTGGAGITVRLPGSTIGQVLTDSQPVVWQFVVTGSVQGAEGLVYDVTPGDQVGGSTGYRALASGTADPNTVLGVSTLKIFRPGSNGCESVPATPTGAEGKNVIVYDGDDHELVAAAAHPTGASGWQIWCAALTSDATDSVYAGDAEVEGTADDGTTSRARDTWRARLTPDPAAEPDVLIALDPAATHP